MGFLLNSKFQVTVPEKIQQSLGVKPGDLIDFELRSNGQVFMVAAKSSKVSKQKMPHLALQASKTTFS
jgi:bifunctional DNA-binding transcriptional regulator/antitoxin component of YhaV-PrlF toxin-antitoxin module